VSLEIRNTGAGPLSFRLLDQPDWLNLRPSGQVRVEQGQNDLLNLEIARVLEAHYDRP